MTSLDDMGFMLSKTPAGSGIHSIIAGIKK